MRLIVLAASLATISALRLSAAKAAPAQAGTARRGRAVAQALGDSTADRKERLWSAWKLDPPQLTGPEGSLFCDCTMVRIVLSRPWPWP